MNFTEKFEERVKKTIKEYKLLSKKDNILVACSGGKDSTAVLYILKKLGYNVEALIVDLMIGNYSKNNLLNIRNFAKAYKIRLHETSFAKEFGHSKCKIEAILKLKGNAFNSSCTFCGVLRKWVLNRLARQLKFDKIVTGHNLDDEAQAVMMNYFRNTMHMQSRLGPVSGNIKDKRFIPRVKPLYFCLERDVRKYTEAMEFELVYDRCPCIQNSFRSKIKDILNNMPNPDNVKSNIVYNFIKSLPHIKKIHSKHGKISYCKRCKEPTSDQVCQACRIIERLK